MLYQQKGTYCKRSFCFGFYAFFILTKRTSNVEHHKGQVSLPGGAIDNNESALDASTREAQEEIGVDPSTLKFLGNLTSLYTPVSHFNIHTFLWHSKNKPKIEINKNEVEEVYLISFNELINNDLVSHTPIYKSGMKINVPAYHFNECICWGATAMILTELKDLLNEVYRHENPGRFLKFVFLGKKQRLFFKKSKWML